MNTQRIRVNIIPDGRIPPFFVSEGDHGEGLFECEIYKGLTAYNIPENYTIMVNQRRPDGHEVIGYAAYSGNVITINCTTSMTDVAGYSLCELRFIDTDGNAFATSNFAICVKSSAVDDSTRQDSDYNILYLIEDSLNQKEASTKEYSETAQGAADAALASESKAKASEEAAASSEAAASASLAALQQSEANAKASQDAAAQSEANAKASENAALSSETNAKASETAAATSETNSKASEAAAAVSEANAKASETAAAQSEANAKASEEAALISENNAKTSEEAALTSETNAKAHETASLQSETNAKASQDAAAQSEANAKASEEASAASAAESKASEIAAAASSSNAKASETAAATSETNSKTSSDASAASAAKAKISETLAAKSETNANASASSAAVSATNASASESNASSSAAAAAQSEANAKTSETNAATSATNAAVSEQNASASATSAETYAASAKVSADKAEAVSSVSVATTTSAGVVKPDGSTITIDADGTIHGVAEIGIATTSTTGIVKPDGTSITIDDNGMITSVRQSYTKSDVGLSNVDNTSDADKSVKNATTVNGHTVDSDVPVGAKFTDTTYTSATSSSDGLISSTDKSKLDSIEDGANKYVHPTYTSHDSGLYKVTIDGTGHVVSVAAVTKSDIAALGIPEQDTTYSNATTDAAGLMSEVDKATLDGVSDKISTLTNEADTAAQNVVALDLAFALFSGSTAAGTTSNIVVETFADDSSLRIEMGKYDADNKRVYA